MTSIHRGAVCRLSLSCFIEQDSKVAGWRCGGFATSCWQKWSSLSTKQGANLPVGLRLACFWVSRRLVSRCLNSLMRLDPSTTHLLQTFSRTGLLLKAGRARLLAGRNFVTESVRGRVPRFGGRRYTSWPEEQQ